MKIISLKTRILVPLTLSLVILLGAFIFNVYYDRHEKITEDVRKQLKSVHGLFERQLRSDAELLSATIEMVSKDRQMQAAWLAKDRSALLKQTSPLLVELRNKHQITHFYFHDADRINFLRVYNPEKHGDFINRFTMLGAERSGQPFSGIELGLLGTFTLRVVHPWRINGELTGYIEMGKEIEHIIKKLRDILAVELYLTIDKKFLVREKWENGMHLLGRRDRWDQFPSSVVVSQSLAVIPEPLSDFLSQERHRPMEMTIGLELSIEGLLYRVGFVPLMDAGQREVGDMVVLYDVTDQVAASGSSIMMVSTICVVVGAILFVFFFIILGRVEQQLEKSRLKLIKESRAREDAQKRLAEETEQERAILQENECKLKEEIIERRRVEGQLRKLSRAVEHSPASIIITDDKGKIEYVNPKFTQITGYSSDEVLGNNPRILKSGEQPPELYKQLWSTILSGKVWRGEFHNRKKNGELYWESASISSITNAEGVITHCIAVKEDITERKKAYEELKAYQLEIEGLNANLEKRVQEELEKSYQKDLIMMRQSRMAAMGRMIEYIAHQWKQPLNALNIILFQIKDLLGDDESSEEEIDEFIEKGEHLVKRMSITVDDFKNFFKPNKEKEEFSVNRIIKDSLALLGDDFKYENISVIFNPKDDILAFGFPNLYSQVVLNILNNAKDAIIERKANGEIIIDMFQEGDFAVIKTKDNGGGIPESVLNKIFDPYFSTKEEKKGSGIGLYMSKIIIEDHMDGTIEVKNIEDGAEFKIVTPLSISA